MNPVPLLAAGLLTGAAAPVAAVPEKPNIIYILADDLGYGDLGCYGQKDIRTPRLDRMAAEGLRFTAHYAGSTVCAPSRAALLTGRDPAHMAVRGNGNHSALPPDPAEPTLASLLKTRGYATAMIGKSGVTGTDADPNSPHAKGFDYFFGYLTHTAAHRHYPAELTRNRKTVSLAGNQGKTGVRYAGDVLTEDALKWLAEHRDGPFLLHLALTAPHADIACPQDSVAPYLGKFKETAYADGGYAANPHPMASYAGMVSRLDGQVGEVLDKLAALGIAERTLVIFASDNGPHSEGGMEPENFNSNGPFRGGKRDLYEGGIRVPMLAWWPGTIAAGRTSDHVSAFWDVMPTVAELAGIQQKPLSEGISLVPTLTGKGEQPSHASLYWEFHERGGNQAVRLGSWKGIRLNAHKKPEGPIELYDLDADPGELRDVAAANPAVVGKIAAIMAARTPAANPAWNFPARK